MPSSSPDRYSSAVATVGSQTPFVRTVGHHARPEGAEFALGQYVGGQVVRHGEILRDLALDLGDQPLNRFRFSGDHGE